MVKQVVLSSERVPFVETIRVFPNVGGDFRKSFKAQIPSALQLFIYIIYVLRSGKTDYAVKAYIPTIRPLLKKQRNGVVRPKQFDFQWFYGKQKPPPNEFDNFCTIITYYKKLRKVHFFADIQHIGF